MKKSLSLIFPTAPNNVEEIVIPSLQELPAVSRQLLEKAGSKKVFLFHAPMGAGKTTLIKALCDALGVSDHVSSPTFSIVNEYRGEKSTVYHFDFYRIKNEQEALDLGYEEYFYSGHYCFVEWPEKIPSLLPADALHLRIEILSETSRMLCFGEGAV